MDEKEIKEKLYQKCLRYIVLRPRTEKELQLYLQKKAGEGNTNLIDELIQQLIQEELINDDEFIEWWVDQRSYFRPKGRRVLEMELRNKGVSREAIDAYFEKMTLDEVDLAQQALSSRLKRFSGLSKQDRYQKSIAFLLSRGFSWSTAKKAFEQSELIE